MTPEQDTFLDEHRWALLATIRRNGSPQVSMVAYHWDGTDVVVSCFGRSAKARNVRRRPEVVVAVADGRRYLSVAGRAEVIDEGEALTALTVRLQGSLEERDAATLQRDIDDGLESVGRVILRVTPERATGRI